MKSLCQAYNQQKCAVCDIKFVLAEGEFPNTYKVINKKRICEGCLKKYIGDKNLSSSETDEIALSIKEIPLESIKAVILENEAKAKEEAKIKAEAKAKERKERAEAKKICQACGDKIEFSFNRVEITWEKWICKECLKKYSGVKKLSSAQITEIILSMKKMSLESIKTKILENEAKVKVKSSKLSIADEIRKFKILLDDGIITEEEFDAKKNKLLGK